MTVALWIFGGQVGIGAVAAALLGLSIMLITNVVTWKECLSNNAAWDTLTWFAALIGMASYLNKYGFIKWFSDQVSTHLRAATERQPPNDLPAPAGSRVTPLLPTAQVVNVVSSFGLSWQASFAVITLLYFYSHYLFASGAAHIGAMYTAFLSVAIACGAPPMVAAIALGQLSNVMGCLTTYGIGSAPPYFGAGYVPQSKWYQYGLLLSFVYLAVWIFAGGAWWKFIGLW